MPFADIHLHALFGVDDGAGTPEDMAKLLDASYRDGERLICLTPHYHPGYFGENRVTVQKHFSVLQQEAEQRWPGMRITLGNELRYDQNCVSWLDEGLCRTMNGTRYVLTDFLEGEERSFILNGLNELLRAGYLPILAHAERYRNLTRNLSDIRDIRSKGIPIQVNAQSVLGNASFSERGRCRRMLANRLVDFVGSDAHNTTRRPPGISSCAAALKEKFGSDYAQALCYENASRILDGKTIMTNWR